MLARRWAIHAHRTPALHTPAAPAEGSTDGEEAKVRGSQEFEGKPSGSFITKTEGAPPAEAAAPAQA